MPLNSVDVRRIATLARLDLCEVEQADLLVQLNEFFSIVERMRAVDTSGVEPLYTPLSALGTVEARLRPDAVSEVVDREANQRSAPQVESGLFLVPRVIE